MADDGQHDPASLKAMLATTLLPTLLLGVGQGAILPVMALSARDMGASITVAALVVGLIGVGRLVGDLPAGTLVTRAGERNAILGSIAVGTASMVVCLLAPAVWVLGAGACGAGVATALFGVARHAYLTETSPVGMRARVMSTVAGANRVGLFIGPFLTALATSWLGLAGAYWINLVAGLCVGVLIALLPDHIRLDTPRAAEERSSIRAVAREHAGMLSRLGAAVLSVGAVRSIRPVAIPLWAEHIGLSAADAGLIFGIAGALDMLLFYPAGSAMDRYGRLVVAAPSMLLLGLGFAAVPLTGTFGELTAAAAVLGIGNGIGSGIMMTIGSDVAPALGRAEFLSIWRFSSDSGQAAGPIAVGFIAGFAGLGGGVVSMAGLAAAAALGMIRWIPRYSQRDPGPEA